MLKKTLGAVALMLMLGAAPMTTHAATRHAVHHVRHLRTRTTYVQPAAITTGNSYQYGQPTTVTGKVNQKLWDARHKVAYDTWRLTHKPDAAEQAADARHEAADRAREASLHRTR